MKKWVFCGSALSAEEKVRRIERPLFLLRMPSHRTDYLVYVCMESQCGCSGLDHCISFGHDTK